MTPREDNRVRAVKLFECPMCGRRFLDRPTCRCHMDMKHRAIGHVTNREQKQVTDALQSLRLNRLIGHGFVILRSNGNITKGICLGVQISRTMGRDARFKNRIFLDLYYKDYGTQHDINYWHEQGMPANIKGYLGSFDICHLYQTRREALAARDRLKEVPVPDENSGENG